MFITCSRHVLSSQVSRPMKIRPAVKVSLIVFASLAAIGVSWQGYVEYRIGGYALKSVTPGRINIIAISPEAGYKIIVANQIAKLVEVEGSGQAGEWTDLSPDALANAPRLPLRELLLTLQGDEEALGGLIERLNGLNESDLPTREVIWTADDIRKAISGDQELEARLTFDLNVDLDGMPIGSINMDSILDGIVIELPIQMDISIGGKTRTMTGIVKVPYRPKFCRDYEERIRQKFNPTDSYLKGQYREEVDEYLDSVNQENVRFSLESRIASDRREFLKRKPYQILRNTQVLVNESHVLSASFETYPAGRNTFLNNITIELTDEGRMQLWKYSHDNKKPGRTDNFLNLFRSKNRPAKGFQLLFIVDAIAIAAPEITSDLAERKILIKGVPSKELVENAVNLLNEAVQSRK